MNHSAIITGIDKEKGLITVNQNLSMAYKKNLYMANSRTLFPFINVWQTETGSTIQMNPIFAKLYSIDQEVYVKDDQPLSISSNGCGCGL